MIVQRPHIENIRKVLEYLRASRISWFSLAFPAICAIGASLCEGATLALLIPTIRAMIESDTHFIVDIPAIGAFLKMTVGESGSRDPRLIVSLVGATFLTAVLKTAFGYASSLTTSRLIKRFANSLRKQIYDRYLDCGKLFFDKSNMGYLHQVLVSYVSTLSSGALSPLQGALYALSTLVVYLGMMFLMSWRLTFIVLLAFPLLHYSLRWLIRKIERTSQSYADSYNQLGKQISNALSSIPLVKAYCAEDRERVSFGHLSDQVQHLEYSIEKKTLLVNPIQEIILLCFMFSLVLVIQMIVLEEGTKELATYAVFLLTLRRSAAMFGVFNSILASFASVSGSIAEIGKVFSDDGKFLMPNGTRTFAGLRGSIECKNLSFRYPDGVEALSNVSCYLTRGSVTALVGQSGSGKSTFVNLLMRFYDCEPGSILVDGRDIRELDIPSWRNHVALVSQDTYLFHATLRYNLLYGLNRDVSDEELAEVLRQSRLTDLVETLPLGLETELGDRGVKLSGGERQRVSIARAMLKRADILLLDEATSSLDSQTERLIQDALELLIKEKTVIVVAHRLSTIRNADQILVLHNGVLIEQGTLTQLLTSRGQFFRFWEEQRM